MEPNDQLKRLQKLSPSKRALLMKKLREEAARKEKVGAIPRRDGKSHPPLSFAQERIWLFEQLAPGTAVYNVPWIICLTGPLNVNVLESSLNEIIARHETLRTTFRQVDGRVAQVIAPSQPLRLTVVDLRELGGRAREAKAEQLLSQEGRRPFDLDRGPVVRSLLIQVGEEESLLLVTMHHIVTDGWSIGVLASEMRALYEAASRGEEAELPELEIQYADFAVWQREWLRGEVLERQLEYWKRQLRNLPTLDLPTDYPRPVIPSFKSAYEKFVIPETLADALKVLGRSEEATLLMTLLAAFNTILYRYSGQQDVVVGTDLANRTRAETEALIGFFVNMLVIRSDLSGNPTFRELVRRVRQVALEAYANQDIAFQQLTDELQSERDLNRTPLFQVVFVLQNAPEPSPNISGLKVDLRYVETRATQFDLIMTLEEEADRLIGRLDYSVDLFEAATAGRLVTHFRRLLEAIAGDDTQQLSEITILTDAEKHQLLVDWNQTERSYPREGAIHEIYEAQAERRAKKIAVVMKNEWLTYEELNAKANQLAHYLRKLGVGPELRVGVFLDRSIDLVVGILGILKAGGAYVPLDPSYPLERLAFMLEDAQIQIVITNESCSSNLVANWLQVVCLDSDWETIASESPLNPRAGASAGNLAYVSYTSGSMGRPKGVEICHRGVLKLLLGIEYVRLDERETLLHLSPLAFDASTFEIWGALLHGGRCVLLAERTVTLEGLASALAGEQVTTLWLTASLYNTVIDKRPEALQGVRQLLIGGEALSAEHVDQGLQLLPSTSIINGYGPTEGATFTCCYNIPRELINGRKSVPIGRPIANTKVYVLDRNLEIVPVGAPGELHIAGDGLARGYLNRPELTAEKFIPDPFGREKGARIYKTGDLVKYLTDGRIDFLGRIDNQVKVRGYRIEIGEIETALKQRLDVEQVVVIARDDLAATKQLVAYVVPVMGVALDGSDLRRYLKEKLPEYMIPAAFVVLDFLPLSSNGKIDLNSLPGPESTYRKSGIEFIAPRTNTEEELARIWSQVLGREKVGVSDNFFDSGGDSLRGIQVVSMAKEVRLRFSIQHLFLHPTIRELAEALQPVENQAGVTRRIEPFCQVSEPDRERLPAGVDDAYPLTRLQAGMIFHSAHGPETSVYHDIFSFRVTAPFDAKAMRETLNELVGRHPILRTSFDLTGYSEPIQLLNRNVVLPLQIGDIRSHSTAEQERALAAFVENERRSPFDWERAPLLRVHLDQRRSSCFQLTLSFHHAILDGWSLMSLLTELLQRYWSLITNEPSRIGPPPASTYGEFVDLEKEATESETNRRFWREKMARSEATVLPRWFMGERLRDDHDIRAINFSLPQKVVEGLKDLAQSAGTPLKSVLLGAHLRVLNLLGGQRDIVTGLVCNGRPESTDGERVLGLFLNTLPLRLRLEGGTWRDLARETFEAENEMLPHRRFPLVELQKMVGGHPLFETVFIFVHFHVYQRVRRLKGWEIRLEHHVANTNFPLLTSFVVDLESSDLQLDLRYDAGVLSERQVRFFASYYQKALESMAVAPDLRYESQCLLSEEELDQILLDWNDTHAEYPLDLCLHELFQEQARRRPEAIAAECQGRLVTYQELNRRANQAANYLRGIGVGAEARVGICMGRGIDMVVGLLAILKAGGAYVPLDSGYPGERLGYMFEDASVEVALTQKELQEGLSWNRAATVLLDADWAVISRQRYDNPVSNVTPENLAYIIYTSGSTGEPKGVGITHKNATAFLQWARDHFSNLELSVVLASTSICFDLSVFEIFAPLVSGGKMVITQNALEVTAETSGVRLINTVPSAMAEMLRMGKTLESVVTVNLAGEALRRSLVDEVYQKSDVKKVINLYGPTEYTTYTTCVEVGRDHVGEPAIGKPIANTQVYVLDQRHDPAPVGVIGELFISGAGLARGYINRPELTAERFLLNPFSQVPGARMYRTGDLIRYNEDGNIEFLGRIDHQVKLRGYRIELGEIEAALSKHDTVSEAVVMVKEDQSAGKRLVAYVVAGREGDSDILRQYLQEKLPNYMIPVTYVMLDSLPLTPSGKVDRRALAASGPARPSSEKAYVSPRTSAEEALAKIWAEVLKVDRVGRDDNFFHLGGDSILSLQIVSRANQLGLGLTSKQLFRSPTIAELEPLVGSAKTIKAEQFPVKGNVPLTPAQHWFFEKNLDRVQHWNQAFLFVIHKRTDARFLEQAVLKLIERHDALRIRFMPVPSGWRQFNKASQQESAFTRVDLVMLKGLEQTGAIEAVAAATQASLDLYHGPIFRAVLFENGPPESERLLIVVHHLVIDFVSWRIILEDLQDAYERLDRGEAPRLPAKTSSFKQWAERLLSYPEIYSETDFWLAGPEAENSCLPVERETGLNTEASAHTIKVALSVDETEALLRDAPAAYHTQTTDLLLTAVIQEFERWTGAQSLLIDLEGHGREEVFDDLDLSRTVGWFTTIFPVCLSVKRATGPGEQIKAVKERLRRIPNRGMGYGVLRYLIKDESVRTSLRNRPGAQVSFNFLGHFDQVLSADSLFSLAGESCGPDRSPSDLRGHLLEVTGAIVGGRLEMMWTYSENIHSRSTIEQVASGFINKLQKLIEHCRSEKTGGYTPSDFPLSGLSQGELDRIAGPATDIEDIYPLAPMQQGMLFHTRYAPESGVYFEQLRLTIQEDINTVALEEAWRQVISLYPILRSCFFAESLSRPVQVVRSKAEIPFESFDWRMIPANQQRHELLSFLKDDRKLGFDLQRAPLMRVTLIRMDTDTYELIWSRHHLIVDGWSIPIVLKTLLDCYHAICDGKSIEIEGGRPYRDYIAWLQRQDHESAKTFWRRKLQGFFSPIRLNTGDRVNLLPEDVAECCDQHILLSEKTTERLRAFGRERLLTLNTLVQGAWAILLSRYSGQEDVVFGTTVSGRPGEIAGIESMVGLFINTLATRLRVSSGEFIAPWLKGVQDQQTEMWQYEYSPLVQVQAWSEVEPGAPLFESVVVFENYPIDLAMKEWGEWAQETWVYSKTNYPLTLAALPGTRLALHLSYDPERFGPATITRILEHLTNLLEALVSDGPARIVDISLMSEAERYQVIHEWNETRAPYPSQACIQELFERQVEANGEAIALAYGQERVSYRELNERSNRLARWLLAQGVGPENRVGVCLERSVETIVSLLGVLKAGAAYLPLEAEHPALRLHYMILDAEAKVIITRQRFKDILAPLDVKLVCPDDDREEISAQSEWNLGLEISADHLAYVVYTSGTTGKPKGVMLLHRGVCNLGWAQIRAFHIQADSRVLQFASLSFDASVSEIFTALLSGATLWLSDPASLRSGPDLIRTIRESRITTVTLPPSVLATMGSEDLPDLSVIISAGEPCTEDILRRWASDRSFLNAYGPTETTVCATIAGCSHGKRQLTIGAPMANTQVLLLDDHLHPVPVGAPGEIHIGGVGLARAYINNPELTAEKFIPNPFAGEPGARLYKSGDLARYLPNGEIEFIGRRDNQLKVRGYRIEAEEIEAVLCSHPAVRDSVVCGHGKSPEERRLVAYVIPQEEVSPSASELRSYLRERLPEYMIPAAYVSLAAFPLTPNHKVDRQALPQPGRPSIGVEEPLVAPRTPIEQAIVHIWEGVLQLEQIGVYDNFFQLGGHSLLAIQLISRINEALDTELSIRCLFESPTIAELAERVAQYQLESADPVESADPADLAAVLSQMNELTDEEVRALLISELQSNNPSVDLP